jgi:hypothetical protein
VPEACPAELVCDSGASSAPRSASVSTVFLRQQTLSGVVVVLVQIPAGRDRPQDLLAQLSLSRWRLDVAARRAAWVSIGEQTRERKSESAAGAAE